MASTYYKLIQVGSSVEPTSYPLTGAIYARLVIPNGKVCIVDGVTMDATGAGSLVLEIPSLTDSRGAAIPLDCSMRISALADAQTPIAFLLLQFLRP